MTVKIIIKRNIPKETKEQVFPLFRQLRELAMKQDGYVTGETLRNYDDSEDYVVISMWRSAEDWKAWEANPKRKEFQKIIDAMTDKKTEYGIYYYA